MENVLAVYERPHDPRFSVVCFDGRPCVLHGQPVEPLPPVPAQPAAGEQPARAGRPRWESSPYVRQGTACLLAAFGPGTGQRLPAAKARVLAARSEGHYTPENASWLNMVEFELSAIARQCLHQRIPTQDELTAHAAACVAKRNAAHATVHWQLTLEKARTKPGRHYQKIRVPNSSD